MVLQFNRPGPRSALGIGGDLRFCRRTYIHHFQAALIVSNDEVICLKADILCKPICISVSQESCVLWVTHVDDRDALPTVCHVNKWKRDRNSFPISRSV